MLPRRQHSNPRGVIMTMEKQSEVGQNIPAKLLRAKLLAANALAAYNGYASTKNVKTPLKTSRVLPSG